MNVNLVQSFTSLNVACIRIMNTYIWCTTRINDCTLSNSNKKYKFCFWEPHKITLAFCCRHRCIHTSLSSFTFKNCRSKFNKYFLFTCDDNHDDLLECERSATRLFALNTKTAINMHIIVQNEFVRNTYFIHIQKFYIIVHMCTYFYYIVLCW